MWGILPHVPEPMNVLETPRLTLRHFMLDDAPFAFELVNDPAWIEHIGDRKVRTLDDARGYIQKTLNMVASAGFGLYVVVSRETGEAVGICGLIRRAGLADPDIGFAFLPKGRGKGYALESAAAVLAYGRDTLRMKRIVAIVSAANTRSIRILEAIGLRYEGLTRLPDGEEVPLYALDTGAADPTAPSRPAPEP